MATRVKTGGRRRGSIDREERKVLTDRMAGDLMWCYTKMGGRDWLLEFAKANPAEFIKSGLSRLWPAPQKSDDESGGGTYNQFNINNISDRDAAMRISYVLNAAMHPDPSLVIEHEAAERVPVAPQEYINPPRWRPPVDAPDMPEPVEDPEKLRWVEELNLTPEQRRDNAAIRETREATIESYAGGTAEQGHGPILSPGSIDRDPRAAQRDRILRRNQLL